MDARTWLTILCLGLPGVVALLGLPFLIVCGIFQQRLTIQVMFLVTALYAMLFTLLAGFLRLVNGS